MLAWSEKAVRLGYLWRNREQLRATSDFQGGVTSGGRISTEVQVEGGEGAAFSQSLRNE